MKRTVFLPLFCICFISHAQIYFDRMYDSKQYDGATSLIHTIDSYEEHIIAAQEYFSGTGGLFIIKINNIGDTIWTRHYSKNRHIYYTGLSGSSIITKDSAYIFGGAITNLDDTINTADALLVKLDKNGDTVWTKIYGGPYFDATRICAETKDSGYILIGDTDPGNNGKDEFLLIKTNSMGNLQWQKTYGGGGADVAISGQVTLDGGYILSGSTNSFGIGGSDHYLVKTDSAGNMQWQKTFGTSLDDGGCYVIQTKDSGYILTGQLNLGAGKNNDGAIRKINKSGNQVWLKTFGTVKDDWFDSRAIELSDGSIVAAGSSVNSQNIPIGWLFKVNANGDSLWERKYFTRADRDNYFYDVKSTSDGGFIMCGTAWDITQDVWVVKVDSMGCEVANCNIGIDDKFKVSSLRFQIYPNPNNGRFILRSEESTANITFINVLGITVHEEQISQSETEIDISNFPAGIYVLKIETNEQVSYVKVVLE